MTHSTLLKLKQQLETELEQINKQLNDRRPTRTMEEVVEAVILFRALPSAVQTLLHYPPPANCKPSTMCRTSARR